jgi:hypothetical protein
MKLNDEQPVASVEARREKKLYIAAGAKFLNILQRHFGQQGQSDWGVPLSGLINHNGRPLLLATHTNESDWFIDEPACIQAMIDPAQL